MKKWSKRIALVLMVAALVAGIGLYQGDLSKEVVDAKYSNAASQFLTADSGSRIHFRDQGQSDGPPLVLIHGFNASLHTWEPWVERLGNRFRVITLDLPAHGLTGSIPDADYSAANQVATVDAIVTHLGVDRFVLGGNSMGGGVTWRYALEHPEKVSAMILVDAVGLPQWESEASQSLSKRDKEGPIAFRLLRQGWFRAIAKYLDPYPLTKQGLISAYTDSSLVTDELIERYYELTLREGTRGAIMARVASQLAESPDQPVDPTALDVPTLILWGRDDALIPVEVAQKFADTLPESSLVIYDNVGHLPMEELAEQSASDVLEFLDQLPDAPEASEGTDDAESTTDAGEQDAGEQDAGEQDAETKDAVESDAEESAPQ